MILIKTNGEIICYHRYYDEISLDNFLYKNTRFETGSTNRYEIGSIIPSSQENEYYMNLNLHID